MRQATFSINTKTLNVKGSRANDTAAQAAAVMLTVDTDVLSADRSLVTVYLNCDVSGTSTLDVDFQITPDDSSQVWYSVFAFQQVLALVSKQAITPGSLGRHCRCYPTVAGTHNFGCQISFPLRGYVGS